MRWSTIYPFFLHLCQYEVALADDITIKGDADPAAATSTSTLTPSTSTTTLSTASSTGSAAFADPAAFQSAILNSTNTFRHAHYAANLTWNDSLASYAEEHVSNCVFEHTGGPYGENIAEGYPSPGASVDAWGDEGKQYNYAAGQFSDSTGHFTQLVWNASTTCGCAAKNCSGSSSVGSGGGNGQAVWYLMCEYYPAGNIEGDFKQNVLNSPSGKSSSATVSREWSAWSVGCIIVALAMAAL